ncbi:4Fe-4S binding protein [Desulforhopalus singaporensis]|uniref:2-oxoglutarate ferredoxin oxidoreductase subunit delta n=1 Tax=Desulforhopalus singaporensis TaxID=91360 RepID=A0A1H0N8D5_9BACT|nr:4Fe-4S binding protein [Desulforhopalus singaporensis]SDO88918.1 2-oxoglutarate ferredoxin oxidoreductase subunit delta [Desulforhopalus singaporensis]
MKKNKTLVINSARCKACGLCIHFCPKKALSLCGEFNDMGYNFVQSDQELCVKCNTCGTICPDVVLKVVED